MLIRKVLTRPHGYCLAVVGMVLNALSRNWQSRKSESQNDMSTQSNPRLSNPYIRALIRLSFIYTLYSPYLPHITRQAYTLCDSSTIIPTTTHTINWHRNRRPQLRITVVIRRINGLDLANRGSILPRNVHVCPILKPVKPVLRTCIYRISTTNVRLANIVLCLNYSINLVKCFLDYISYIML